MIDLRFASEKRQVNLNLIDLTRFRGVSFRGCFFEANFYHEVRRFKIRISMIGRRDKIEFCPPSN